jgi:putative transposase
VTSFHARRLPHYHSIGQPTFLTWLLAGTLPKGRSFSHATAGESFLAMDRLLDNARTVEAILHRDSVCYELHSYVLMANHVHLLITPRVDVSKLTQSLKRFTARKANRMLGRTGSPFWQDESYDRLIRDPQEFNRIATYIEMNPVRAGLVATPEVFQWSSAWPIENRRKEM